MVNSKNTLILLVVIIVLSLVVLMVAAFAHNQRLQLQYAQAVYHRTQADFSRQGAQLVATKNVLSEKINELGQHEMKVKVVEGNYDQLKALQQAQYGAFARTLKEFGVDLKNLKSVTNLRVETSGQFVTITRDSITENVVQRPAGDSVGSDTVRQIFRVINYKEPAGWFTMQGTIKGDSMSFAPTFYNDFSIVAHSERAPRRAWWDLFPPRRTVATVVDKNPYTKSSQLEQVILSKRRNRRFLQ